MKDAITHVPAVIFEFTAFADGVQRFTYVSEPSRAILGISATALLANPRQLFSAIHPDDLSQLKKALTARSEGQCCTCWRGRVRTDENEKWIEMRISAACGVNGEIVSRGVILEEAGVRPVTNEKSGRRGDRSC